MTVIWIKLECKGDADGAMEIVDRVLDNGDFQDAVNEYASDNDIDVEVESATANFSPEALGHTVDDCPHVATTVRTDMTERCLNCDKELGKAGECAECQQTVPFSDGQPLPHDDNSGKRCGS